VTKAACPDPDTLLQQAQQDEKRARRNTLKIHFGASVGIGDRFRA